KRHYPGRILLDDGRGHSLSDLDRTAELVALRLIASGASPGSRIAILAPNGVPWFIAALAVLQIGATVVPVSTRYHPREAADVIRRPGSELTVATTDFLGRDHAHELRTIAPNIAILDLDGAESIIDADIPACEPPSGGLARHRAALEQFRQRVTP